MSRTIRCPANQWTTIFNHMFVQFPTGWTISFTTADGAAVAGEVVEQRSAWIFPQTPTTLALAPRMHFTRGWWNTFYSLRVRPTSDIVAQIERG